MADFAADIHCRFGTSVLRHFDKLSDRNGRDENDSPRPQKSKLDLYFNEYSTTRAVAGGTTVESETLTVSPVMTFRPLSSPEAISA